MKRLIPFLMLLLASVGSPASAQEADPERSRFDRAALRRALTDVPFQQATLDPRANWAQVRQLPESTEIFMSVRGGTMKKYRLVSVDDAGLTAVDLETTNRPTVRIARDDVSEIRGWQGRRGSIKGAIIGAGIGAFAGVVTALNLAFKDCGGSCTDEKLLIGLSLFGMPTGGGLAGYYLPGGRKLATIYLRS